jgi:hypothetical protein
MLPPAIYDGTTFEIPALEKGPTTGWGVGFIAPFPWFSSVSTFPKVTVTYRREASQPVEDTVPQPDNAL